MTERHFIVASRLVLPSGRHMLEVRLRDNGYSSAPSASDFAALTSDLWGAKVVDIDAKREWLAVSHGWNTKPPTKWPPDMSVPGEPANDVLRIYVVPWRSDAEISRRACAGRKDRTCGNPPARVLIATVDGQESLADDALADEWMLVRGNWLCEECAP